MFCMGGWERASLQRGEPERVALGWEDDRWVPDETNALAHKEKEEKPLENLVSWGIPP